MKKVIPFLVVFGVFAVFVLCAGCTSPETKAVPANNTFSYSVSGAGVLNVEKVDYSYSLGNVTNAGENGSVKVSEILMKGDDSTGVYALLAEPKDPVAGIVFAPGAGVSADSHLNRSIAYAESGIAFMVVDVRGNGGKTTGYPLNLQKDLDVISGGGIPQNYLIVFDMIAAKDYLKEIYGEGFPVYAMGSSNGGRYAAVAAGSDKSFSGYFGVSTSGYDYDEGVNGDEVDRFINSINPYTYIGNMTPEPVVIFHAPNDNIIDFEYGYELYENASEPKTFVSFNGTHGINGEVDSYIEALLSNYTKA
ncbi:dienelactone hydrolase [Methanomicrobium sp. W14]|uniref:alpha/beta hydrolase family protein n=1 Tax=Methanomicrobium sp. W14 TaxID=2817839 RepID=UPI001AE1D5F3|nr:alpha/beta hydrolase [Methanomicrobium sp. W14]MBP2133842.1 dienelactone hydrolase [Methanomicrobium sp. W14]